MSDSDQNIITKKVVFGSLWVYLDKLITQLVTFSVSIFLARILTPEIYGTIALVTIFITIADVFVSSGFGNSLIQKKMPDETDYSTALISGVVMAIVIYALLYSTAPIISKFYSRDELTLIVRVMAIRVIFAAVNSIQRAYIQKQFDFKVIFITGFTSSLLSGILGIFMALRGYGVWSLVSQNLAQSVIITIFLGISSGLKPNCKFSFSRLVPMFSYGWKILLVNLTDIIYANLGGLFIGKTYSSADLAYYNKGNQLPEIVVANINSTINTVMFPILSNVQDDVVAAKAIARNAIKISTFLLSPLLVGLAVCAEPIIQILLTEKWSNSVIYVQILCLVYLSMPINSINQLVMNSLGRSDIFLGIGILKKILGIISIIISILLFDGPISVALASLISAPIVCFINMFPNKKLINYSISEQILDVLPSIVLSIIMGIIVYFVSMVPMDIVGRLSLQIIVGGIVYVGLAMIFRLGEATNILHTLLGFGQRKTNG